MFKKDIASLVPPIEEVGNLFEEDSKDLYVLHSKLIVGDLAMQNVKNVVQYNVEEDQESDFSIKQEKAPIA